MHQPLTFRVIGDAIREERMQAGMTRAELAHQVGVTERYIGHLENGTRECMRPKPYKRLREALKATDERLQLPPPRPTEADPPERT